MFLSGSKPCSIMRVVPLIFLAVALSAAPLLAETPAAKLYDFSIPAGPLESVLNQFVRITSTNLSYADELPETAQSAGVNGRYPAEAALQTILSDTGVTAKPQNGGGFLLLTAPQATETQPTSEQKKSKTTMSEIQQDRMEMTLENMTVTAQKTEEKVHDVPISISVFDEVFLEDRMIDSVADISLYTPGFDIVDNGLGLVYAPTIRGLFSSAGIKPVAGLFIDGIPMFKGGYDLALMDIQRVEVLKGPQGTLYGKNAEAGVINVISRKPDNETRGKIKASLGTDNKRELACSVSGPIVRDKFYIALAGKHYEKDGFIKNTYKDKMEDDREHNFGKINLRWTPTDDLELFLISSKIKYNEGGAKEGSNKTYREVSNDFDTFNKSDTVSNALNISYNINDTLSLASTTTHTKENKNIAFDFDYSNILKSHILDCSTSKLLSEELKLNYENDNMRLVSGIYIEDEKSTLDRDAIKAAGTTHSANDITADSIGVFSHVTYDINERLSVLGGLRYDNVKQEYKDSTQTIDNDESEVSPKIGLTYDLKENMMTYATISKGYRSGGFNNSALDDLSKTFNKETLYSYEIGLKGIMMDGKLTYDTAVYYMDISDLQVLYFPTVGNWLTTNAAKAISKGIEASLNLSVTDTINLFAGAAYNDVKFDEYNNGKVDFSGNRTTYTPEYNFNIGLTYRAEQGYYASVDICGYGDMYLDLANKYKRDAYELVNAKVGYEQEHYDIYLYAKNLFDKEYDKVTARNIVYADPREIGVQLTFRF